MNYKISRSPCADAIHKISVFSHKQIHIRKKLANKPRKEKKRKLEAFCEAISLFDYHLLVQLIFSLFLFSFEKKKRSPLFPTFLRCYKQQRNFIRPGSRLESAVDTFRVCVYSVYVLGCRQDKAALSTIKK